MADAQQRHVIQTIIAIGRRRNMPRQAILAALTTGAVESHFRNLRGGDRDSAGWRQERRMFYANPRNVVASVNRFYDEWESDARGRGLSVGQQAQAVQQSAFPDRYQAKLPLAKRLLARNAPMPLGAMTGVTGTPPRVRPGSTKVDFGQALIDTLLTNRGRSGLLGRAMHAAETDPQYTTTTPPSVVGGKTRKYRVPAAGPGDVSRTIKGGGKIIEVFYDPLGEYFDNGQVVKGAIGGHGDHVHVSASPRLVVRLGRMAQQMGLHVGENPHFGGVAPVHVKGSFHYSGRAIDVSGDPAKLRQFARHVIRLAH